MEDVSTYYHPHLTNCFNARKSPKLAGKMASQFQSSIRVSKSKSLPTDEGNVVKAFFSKLK